MCSISRSTVLYKNILLALNVHDYLMLISQTQPSIEMLQMKAQIIIIGHSPKRNENKQGKEEFLKYFRRERKRGQISASEGGGQTGSAPFPRHLKHFRMFIIIIWEEMHSDAHTLPANQNIPAGAHKGCVWARVPIMSVDGQSMSVRPCFSACLGG